MTFYGALLWLGFLVGVALLIALLEEAMGDLHYWRICRKQRRLTKEYEARRQEVRR